MTTGSHHIKHQDHTC